MTEKTRTITIKEDSGTFYSIFKKIKGDAEFDFSGIAALFFRPRKSTQKDVVSAVRAPSALGYAAEISPMMKNNADKVPRC